MLTMREKNVILFSFEKHLLDKIYFVKEKVKKILFSKICQRIKHPKIEKKNIGTHKALVNKLQNTHHTRNRGKTFFPQQIGQK